MIVETDSLSRYNGVEVIDDGYQFRQETWDSPDLPYIQGESYTVPAKYANRLDLVANEKLGTPHLWWCIALATGIKDPFAVPAGTSLLIPNEEAVIRMRGMG